MVPCTAEIQIGNYKISLVKKIIKKILTGEIIISFLKIIQQQILLYFLCSEPVVIMTALELPFPFSAEEIFGLSTAEEGKSFSTKCSHCVASCRLAQKICIMEKENQLCNEFLSGLVM